MNTTAVITWIIAGSMWLGVMLSIAHMSQSLVVALEARMDPAVERIMQ